MQPSWGVGGRAILASGIPFLWNLRVLTLAGNPAARDIDALRDALHRYRNVWHATTVSSVDHPLDVRAAQPDTKLVQNHLA